MNKADLKKHLAIEHPQIRKNFGPHFHRATLRDLQVAHDEYHRRNGGAA